MSNIIEKKLIMNITGLSGSWLAPFFQANPFNAMSAQIITQSMMMQTAYWQAFNKEACKIWNQFSWLKFNSDFPGKARKGEPASQ